MSKEFGMLSHWWNGDFKKVEGRYCSRKLNGWSALWDGGITRGLLAKDIPWYYRGKDKMKLSTGLWTLGRDNKPKVLEAPNYFLNNLPQRVPIHGELWYNDNINIIKTYCSRKNMSHPIWHSIKLIGFNIKPYKLWDIRNLLSPTDAYSSIVYDGHPYREVIELFTTLKPNDNFETILTLVINNVEDLINKQQEVINNKWEGLIFADPNGLYECKRSSNSLKWKAKYDYEGVIIDYEMGKTGKNIGNIGSLVTSIIWDNQILEIHGGDKSMVGHEVICNISGLTDQEKKINYIEKIYPIGKKIKFSFFGVTINGVPVSANINRE